MYSHKTSDEDSEDSGLAGATTHMDFSQFKEVVVQIDENNFLLQHTSDSSKDILITMHIDKAKKQVNWTNLPNSLQTELPSDFETLRENPLKSINRVFQKVKSS